MAELKDMLKYYREAEGLTQKELAQKVKVSPAAIGMYESGTRMPKKEIEETLADYFNISIDTLRGKDTETHTQKLDVYSLFAGAGTISLDDEKFITDYLSKSPNTRKKIREITSIIVS